MHDEDCDIDNGLATFLVMRDNGAVEVFLLWVVGPPRKNRTGTWRIPQPLHPPSSPQNATMERLKVAHQGSLEDYEKLRAETTSRIASLSEEIRLLSLTRDTVEAKARNIDSLETGASQLVENLKEAKSRLLKEEEQVLNLRMETLKMTERAEHFEARAQILQQQELSQSRQIHSLEAQVDKLSRDLDSAEAKLASSKEKKRDLVRKVEMQQNREVVDVGAAGWGSLLWRKLWEEFCRKLRKF